MDDPARNIATVQRGWDDFTAEPITMKRINEGGLEPVLEIFDREIVWDISRVFITGTGIYYGHRGVRQFWVDWFEAFDEVTVEVLSLDAIDDKVISHSRQSGQGRGSGTAATMENAMVFTMRNGKVVRLDMYPEIADAHEAAGLDAPTPERLGSG